MLAGRDLTFGPRLDFDPSGRHLLFGVQDTHSETTLWWGGGKAVRVKRIEIGDQPPAFVGGAHVGGGW